MCLADIGRLALLGQVWRAAPWPLEMGQVFQVPGTFAEFTATTVVCCVPWEGEFCTSEWAPLSLIDWRSRAKEKSLEWLVLLLLAFGLACLAGKCVNITVYSESQAQERL
mmetsp:Transcript_1366/g.3042  ORF Transcript_1366/g.3042 Transcript_1366/m.3042 type:complete len:110 (-) Transcript_1366:117-446(-)